MIGTTAAERAEAQLPFDLTREDVAEADTAAMRWSRLATFVGGAEGSLRYLDEEVSEGECRAVAYLAFLRLRNYYTQRREEAPVALRLGFRCGVPYRGTIEYDGIAVRLELRDHASGRILYRGSIRGPP